MTSLFKQSLASLQNYGDASPKYGENCFLADGARLIGDVTMGSDVSLWFNVTVRGDCNWIKIGSQTNVQDNSVVHVTHKTGPVTIGERVTIGHNAVIHACEIGDGSLIGMGAVLLDGAVIGENCIVAAGSVVTPGKKFANGTMIMGSPAKAVRELKEQEYTWLEHSYKNYLTYKAQYIEDMKNSPHS